MSMGVWNRTVRQVSDGAVIADAEVEVRVVQDPDNPDASPVTLATIYEDFDGTTEKANPFQVDSDGVAEFYADGDFYHIIVSANGVTQELLNQPLGTAQARDLVVGADGNVPAWDADGNLVDSGKAAADIGSGGGGSSVALDLGDDGNEESSGLTEIATTGDTNNIATEDAADKLLLDMGQNWPASDIADALSTGALDDIAEIDGTLRTGADTTLVTGTAGTSGNFAMWNADGDLVDSGNSDSDYADAAHTHTLSDITDAGDAAAKGVTGLDANAVTGTAGTAGNVPEWNGDGDIVDSGKAASDIGSGGSAEPFISDPPESDEPTVAESYEVGPTYSAEGDLSFHNGARLGDGRIVFAPREESRIVLFDPSDDSVTLGPTHGQGTLAFSDAVLMNDGRVALIPWDAANIGLFDPSDDSYSDGPAHGKGGTAFFGGALASDGRVIMAPLDSTEVGVFDPSGDTYSDGPTHGEGAGAFRGAVAVDDGRIVFVPWDSANVGVFDPSDDSYTGYTATGVASGFWYGALADDGRVVFAPYSEDTVGLFDPSTNSYSDGPAHGAGSGAFVGAESAVNGKVVIVPYGADVEYALFDPSDDSFTTSGTITNSSEFAGAVEAEDGRIIFVPSNSDNIEWYTPDQTDAYAVDAGDTLDDGDVLDVWLQPNETTTPTLRNKTGEPSANTPIVNRDSSELVIGAIDGAHRLYRDASSPDVWILLDPVTTDPANIESGGAADGDVLTWDASAEQWAPEASTGGEAFPHDPEHATDSSTDAFVSATNTTPPADGVVIIRDFQSPNTTTTPTLDGKTITDRDGNALWANAISGPHTLQWDQTADTYLLLYPRPTDANVNNAPVSRDSNGRAKFADPSAAQDVATKGYVDRRITPVTASDALTFHETTVQAVSGSSYATVFDLASATEIVGGAIISTDPGFRLTIDGTVVIDRTTSARGEDEATNGIGVIYVPPAKADTSMKLEVYNTSTSSRDFGWRIYTR